MSNTAPCKAVLVTGSTRGIGKAIALRLAREGMIVGIHGRSSGTINEMYKQIPRGIPLRYDLDNPENGTKMVDDFHAKAGGLDALVNNAGAGRACAFRGMSLDRWRSTFRLNLESAMLASRQAYGIMRRNASGSIVNIASLAAHGPGRWMGADYAAAKAGLVSMSKSLALEAARFNIRVNVVSPGFVETDMTGKIPRKNREKIAIPAGRFGAPGEIAGVVAFLLSASAGYITGQVIHADGGLWMRE